MAITLASMLANVLVNLDEAANTPAGAESTGTDNTDVQTTTDVVTGYLSDGGALLARTCIPLLDFCTGTLPGGSHYLKMHALAAGTQGELWFPKSCKAGSVTLKFASRSVLEIFNTGLTTNAAGTPKYWFKDGDVVGVDPQPVADTVLTVEGYTTPKRFGGAVTSWTWLPDADHNLVEWYAEIMLALKNRNDQELGSRIIEIASLFDSQRMARWLRVPQATRREAFPTPPVPILQVAAQGGQ